MEDTSQYQSTAAPLGDYDYQYEDEFGATTPLGSTSVPGMEEGALPPLEFGSGKVSPLQQYMPQGSSYVDSAQEAPLETPLRSAVAAPADAGISSPANRGLFPRRM